MYSVQTHLTDPGNYACLYDNLPGTIDSLCLLIKKQLIHPLEALQMGYSLEQVIEEGAIENTEQILEALMRKDSSGLSFDRVADDRLLIACQHHAMLLSSILRHRNIPVRIRFGFARYYEKEAGVRFGHVICEVWDAGEERWMLVDPDRNLTDFSPGRFDFSREAWANLKKGKVDKEVYVSSIGGGLKGAVSMLLLDAAHISLKERMNWMYPAIALNDINEFEDLGRSDKKALDDLAYLMEDPDRNFYIIDSLNRYHPGFQPSDFDYEDYCRMMEERGKE
jgi:hypothetical protein